MPSWNLGDVFGGLATTFPSACEAKPLKSRAFSFGAFTAPVTRLRSFSASYFNFDGGQAGAQLLELRGDGGAFPVPASLRVSLVRVE